MKYAIRSAIVAAAAITITGCSMFAVDVQGPTQYSLTQTPGVHSAKHHSAKILLVMAPEAAPYYKTTQMAYELKPHQVSYYTRNAWAEPPAQMLQPLLVKTLQKTNHFHAIVTPPVTGNYDYMLMTQILTLRANLESCPGVYQITLRAQIIKTSSNKAIATKDITVYEPITCKSAFYSNVLAANRAVAKALAQVTAFTLRSTR
jgi:cholesterol transport system auxiliary component